MRIEVTQADIDAGLRESCVACPVALALHRAFPAADTIRAEYGVLWVWFGEECRAASTPDEASDFMGRFDGLRDVLPFAFDADFGPLPA